MTMLAHPESIFSGRIPRMNKPIRKLMYTRLNLRHDYNQNMRAHPLQIDQVLVCTNIDLRKVVCDMEQ
jgi:hypothetical protein